LPLQSRSLETGPHFSSPVYSFFFFSEIWESFWSN
jgi:hypothetical protein